MRIALYRSAALSLALAAMLLRAILPDGWMPNDHIGGAFFTICSIEPHDGKKRQGEEHTHSPCAFAAASTLAPPTFASFVSGAWSPDFDITADFADKQRSAMPPHRLNAARAPPTLA